MVLSKLAAQRIYHRCWNELQHSKFEGKKGTLSLSIYDCYITIHKVLLVSSTIIYWGGRLLLHDIVLLPSIVIYAVPFT